MAKRTPEGIVARLHLAPPSNAHRQSLSAVAAALVLANVVWLRAQQRSGKRAPRRLLLTRPPWSTRPMQYVLHHGPEPRGRERIYFDGPTAMHVGEATCIELAAYDAAAMLVFENRNAWVHLQGEWPELHAVVRTDSATFDTSTLAGVRASQQGEMPWQRPQS